MKKLLSAVFLLSMMLNAGEVHFTSDGFLNIDGVCFSLRWIDRQWRSSVASDQKTNSVWKLDKAGSSCLEYSVNPPDGAPGKVVMKITPAGKDDFIFNAEAEFSGNCTPNFFGLVIQSMNVCDFGDSDYVIDGTKRKFMTEFKKYLLWSDNCQELKFATRTGHSILSGPMFLHMQDNRRWNSSTYGMRISFTGKSKSFEKASFSMHIKVASQDFSLGRIDRPPYTVTAGKEWVEVENFQDVVSGSALDFSRKLPKTAGELGFLKVKNGRFSFEKAPEKKVKFYGTNLFGTTQVISHRESEVLAKRLASFGFNCVRIHQHDYEICDKSDTRKLDAQKMDNFDYLISCLKKEGLYITTDVYSSRRNITPKELPEYAPILSAAEYKALFWVDDDVFQNWKDAAKNFLTHVNPYTGLALIDDPILVMLCLVNEGNPSEWWNTTGRTVKLYKDGLSAFRRTSGNEKAEMEDYFRYLGAKRYREMREFMLGIGCKVPLTDQNFRCEKNKSLERTIYDYVDNHRYWDHPRFVGKPWMLPVAPNNFNVLNRVSNVPSQLFLTRVYGMPFVVSEFDYASPNIHRLHGPALFSAYAAFQEWDGVFQFAYSHSGPMSFDLTACGHFFDLARDPGKALAYKLGAKIFLDGRVKPADRRIAVRVTEKENEEWSEKAQSLGFVAQTGVDAGKENCKYDKVLTEEFFRKNALNKLEKEGIIPAGRICSNGKFFYTPQILLDTVNGKFRLVSDGAEAVSLQAGQTLGGKVLSVKNGDAEATIAIVPCDASVLSKAKRLVLFHLTDMQSEGRRFSNISMGQMDDWGRVPFLVRRNSAEITLSLPAGEWKIYSLSLSGTRRKILPYTKIADGKIRFVINTADQMVCELVRVQQ